VLRSLFTVALLGCASACAQEGAVVLDNGRFRVAGPPPAEFSVRVAGASDPILGEGKVVDGAFTFTPRFPLRPGLEYVTSCDGVERRFAIPAPPAGPPVRVVEVLPSADRLPENLLRFFVYFSAPMSRGDIYRHVRLLGPDGRPVDLPFLELPQELWNRDGTRVTLLFDPGRIKTGLKPREDSGPALEAGKSYTLVVDAAWPDAAGRPLASEFRKTFSVGPPDEIQPDPKSWTIEAPKAGTSEPLAVDLREPLNVPMLERCLTVLDASRRPVPGLVATDRGETRWRFRPSSPWKAGAYALSVDVGLEDRAGNTVARPFEVDVFRKIEPSVTTVTVERPFEIR
jgi:hypothetical protein